MGNIGTWQLIIVLAIVLLLFGAKRLPEAARGLGRSLKIFKSETQGLINDDKKNDGDEPEPNRQPRAVEATPADPPTTPATPPTTSTSPPAAAEPANDQPRRDV